MQTTQRGIIYALLAYSMWGVAPIYFKYLIEIPALEMVSHRVLWSFVLLLGLVAWRVGWQPVRELCANPKRLGWLLLSSALIAGNWLVFIWAVHVDRMLDASLGYFINPLVNVVLGLLFLQERLARTQWYAVALAATGVLIQIVHYGSVPWVALFLAVSFGLYGLLRKKVTIDGISGLWVETSFLVPVALWYLCTLSPTGVPMAEHHGTTIVWLIAAGLVTTAPLLCFIGAARNMPLSTLGFFQYIGPSSMFFLATFFYGEALSQDKLITFGFIWLALLVFSWHGWQSYRRQRIRM